jgi:L-lysine 6-transaminase
MIGDGFEFVLDMHKSHGSRIIDKLTGRELIDFYSCFASNPIGFNHPGMRDKDFLADLQEAAIHNVTNSDLFTQSKADFVRTWFDKAAPKHMKYMFLVAGGAPAIENSLKAAFDWKIQLNVLRGDTRLLGTRVMHLRGAFHGRTGYTLSLTNTDKIKTARFPKFEWPRIDNPAIVFPDEGKNHESLLKREQKSLNQAQHYIFTRGADIAACIVEPIQGEGGDNHFRAEYLRELQTLCNDNDIMFIVDEVQTGMGMTGKMWAVDHFDLKPDMLVFGKKSQVCGFMCSDKIDSVEKHVFNTSGRINSTWGGNLVDMVRCTRYLEIIDEEKLVDNAARMGEMLLGELQALQKKYPKLLSNARGRGLMCAFDLPKKEQRDELRKRLYEAGLLILVCGERTIRFRPILNVTEKDIKDGISIIDKTLAGF